MSWTRTAKPRGNTRKDRSRSILQALLAKGYNIVQWDSGATVCEKCGPLHGQRWDLKQFITGLRHDAPIFERSHPGCKSCSVIVYSRKSKKLKQMKVDSYGYA